MSPPPKEEVSLQCTTGCLLRKGYRFAGPFCQYFTVESPKPRIPFAILIEPHLVPTLTFENKDLRLYGLSNVNKNGTLLWPVLSKKIGPKPLRKGLN